MCLYKKVIFTSMKCSIVLVFTAITFDIALLFLAKPGERGLNCPRSFFAVVNVSILSLFARTIKLLFLHSISVY